MENMFLSLSRVLEYIGIKPEWNVVTNNSTFQEENSISSSSSASIATASSSSSQNTSSFSSWFFSLFWKKNNNYNVEEENVEEIEKDLEIGNLESTPLLNKNNHEIKSYNNSKNMDSNKNSSILLKGSHLTFSYHPTFPPVLVDVNFELKRGTIIGLSGRTGGGKVI